VLLAIVGLAAPAGAQEIKGGFSMSTIHFSPESGDPDLSSTERLTGFVGGIAFVGGNLGAGGGLQLEVLFHQKGARNLLRSDDELRLGYLEIPVLYHKDVYSRGPRAVYVIAGPAFAFNVQATYEDDGDKEDVQEEIENFDLGLVAGGGVELRRLTIEVRYTWGLRRVFQDGDLAGAFRNRSFSFTVGIRF
jgi:hypothetical protein